MNCVETVGRADEATEAAGCAARDGVMNMSFFSSSPDTGRSGEIVARSSSEPQLEPCAAVASIRIAASSLTAMLDALKRKKGVPPRLTHSADISQWSRHQAGACSSPRQLEQTWCLFLLEIFFPALTEESPSASRLLGEKSLGPLTETYGIPFYLQYLAHWPEYFIVAEAPSGELMGYIMGKAEGSVAREEWHGHVTALSVAPEFRRLGLAAKLMEMLEEISERKGGFFVDLFVRVSNQVAVNMYKRLGYSVYRTVIEYYSASNGEPDEDAYDMRKALSRDSKKKLIIPMPHPVRPEEIE
ncbi:N-alpha-acetyltransferase 20 [Gouania willdenowi]|uniref:N-alpha-acetyltransferase 20 n=1 Tax=Gouania willdenowi TaxID=441366 RepID=UPI001054D3B9|nr:N-alpha-acetyltransferase 20 [Gouania willdenowi]